MKKYFSLDGKEVTVTDDALMRAINQLFVPWE